MKYNEALDFARKEYRKNIDIADEGFIKELTGVAYILDELGFGMEYQVTAVLRNIFRDTEAKPEEVLEYSSMEVLEAIQILTKDLDCDMLRYMSDVKHNMLAMPVKLAEHVYELRNAAGKPNGVIAEILTKSEMYFKKCAQDTIFHEPIVKAAMRLRI